MTESFADPETAPSMITQKAILAAHAGNLNPAAFDIGTISSIITSIFSGLSKCGLVPPTAAAVHRSITNPGLLQRRAMRQTIRQEVDNPSLWAHVEEGILYVGRTSTVDETTRMYSEAVGAPPA